jgi:hypothetical protein
MSVSVRALAGCDLIGSGTVFDLPAISPMAPQAIPTQPPSC